MKTKTIKKFVAILIIEIILIFRDFFITNFLKYTIPAMFTSLGAISMVLFLMFVHFITKRNAYNKIMDITKDDIERTQKVLKIYENKANKVYSMYETKDSMDFLSKLVKKEIVVEPLALDLVQNLEREISKYKNELFKEKMELLHLKNYSFKIYLWSFLNKKYPDDYFNDILKSKDSD